MPVSAARRLVRHARLALLRQTLGDATKAVLRERLTYLSPVKLHRLEAALRRVRDDSIPGDLIEFGVALGGSAILLAKTAQGAGRSFHGFDVFGMIPPPTSDKDDARSKQRYETIASGGSKGIGGSDDYYGYRQDLYGDVCRSLARHGLAVNGSTIMLHKGLFEDTVPAAPLGAVSFAHIDCDWYDPVLYCLTAVADRVSPSGMILIDDYHDYAGCRTATDEFLAHRRDFRFEDGENVLLRRIG
ncbi:TylF/MycF/NovP-related O-methyltransferase [Inquilinus limosus]|nr:TylF/MycF/NovP-related O-methyltransferase [Inquilinus limosus]